MKKRMRAGAVTLLFCACLLLYGCGTETGGSQEPQNEFKIDTASLENQGYKNIADVAYVKLENEGDSTRTRMVYKTKDPVSAFYLLSTIGQEFISAGEDENYIFNWGGQEYDSESIPDDISMDEIYAYYPADWKDVMSKHMSQGIDNIITKSIANEIDRDVDALISDYKEENETEQETAQPETGSDIEEIDSFRFEYDDNNMIIVSLNENGEGEKSLMAIAQLTEGNDFIAISAWLNFTMRSLYEGMDVSALFEIGDDSYFCMIYDGEDKGNTLPDTEDVKTLSDKMIKKTIKFSDELDSFLKKNGVN